MSAPPSHPDPLTFLLHLAHNHNHHRLLTSEIAWYPPPIRDLIPKRGGYYVAEGSGEYISSLTGDLITQRDVDSSPLSFVSYMSTNADSNHHNGCANVNANACVGEE
eukprot:scaffold33340_cov66-Cyclotella_meneghiniana.AAC.2